MEQNVQSLHLPDENRDVVLTACHASGATQPLAQPGVVHRLHDDAGESVGVASMRPSATVATIGFPIASVSNPVTGVPSQT
jgi:hypothetical protein